MGVFKKVQNLSKEYMKDPSGQFFRHLEKILNLHEGSGVSKQEVKDWLKEKGWA